MPVTTQTSVKQKIKTITKINLAIGMVSAFFVGLAMVSNAFLYGPVTWATAKTPVVKDIVRPIITWSEPVNNSVISGKTILKVQSYDNFGTTNVEFYINDALQYVDTTPNGGWQLPWNTTTTTNGAYRLSARAFDAAGNGQTTSPITVTVKN